MRIIYIDHAERRVLLKFIAPEHRYVDVDPTSSGHGDIVISDGVSVTLRFRIGRG